VPASLLTLPALAGPWTGLRVPPGS
jgi:hypothetical protein